MAHHGRARGNKVLEISNQNKTKKTLSVAPYASSSCMGHTATEHATPHAIPPTCNACRVSPGNEALIDESPCDQNTIRARNEDHEKWMPKSTDNDNDNGNHCTQAQVGTWQYTP